MRRTAVLGERVNVGVAVTHSKRTLHRWAVCHLAGLGVVLGTHRLHDCKLHKVESRKHPLARTEGVNEWRGAGLNSEHRWEEPHLWTGPGDVFQSEVVAEATFLVEPLERQLNRVLDHWLAEVVRSGTVWTLTHHLDGRNYTTEPAQSFILAQNSEFLMSRWWISLCSRKKRRRRHVDSSIPCRMAQV